MNISKGAPSIPLQRLFHFFKQQDSFAQLRRASGGGHARYARPYNDDVKKICAVRNG
jgi:hypothetical protein